MKAPASLCALLLDQELRSSRFDRCPPLESLMAKDHHQASWCVRKACFLQFALRHQETKRTIRNTVRPRKANNKTPLKHIRVSQILPLRDWFEHNFIEGLTASGNMNKRHQNQKNKQSWGPENNTVYAGSSQLLHFPEGLQKNTAKTTGGWSKPSTLGDNPPSFSPSQRRP